MSIEEFKNTSWGAGMKGVYCGYSHKVTAVNFPEKLIEIRAPHEDPFWVRCENFDLEPS